MMIEKTVCVPCDPRLTPAENDAYYVRPEGDGIFPAVIVIHEVFGINENIRRIARDFAAEGYAALAIDLFTHRSRFMPLCMLRYLRDQVFCAYTNTTLGDLHGAMDWLENQPEVDKRRLGAIGFCMGGGYAIAWACKDTRLRAIAPFYGNNPRPLDAVRRTCPIVASYPKFDLVACSHISGRRLQSELNRAETQRQDDIKFYPGTKHSFCNKENRPQAYNEAACNDAFERVLTFFARALSSEPAELSSLK